MNANTNGVTIGPPPPNSRSGLFTRMLRSSQPSFWASFHATPPPPRMPRPVSSSTSLSVNFPRLTLPSADPVQGPARPQPSPRAANPLLRSKVPPASPSSDPRGPQLLSLELLPSFHFRDVPGPGASPQPVSGPPSHFRGTLTVFTPPTCTSGPPLSLFLDALQAPKPTSGSPAPSGLQKKNTTHASPRFRQGPSSSRGTGGGNPATPPPAPAQPRFLRPRCPSSVSPVNPPARSFCGPAAARSRPSGGRFAAMTQPGFLGLSVAAPPHRHLPPTPQHIPFPPGRTPPLATAPQLPSWAPKSPVRTRWRGSNFHSLPHPPRQRQRRRRLLGSLQLSAEPQHRGGVRLRLRRLPPRPFQHPQGTTLPSACADGLVRGPGPAPYSRPITSPLPTLTPGSTSRRPATSSRSLRGTRKGNVKLPSISLRRGHPRPSVVAGTNSLSGHPRPEVESSPVRVP